MVCRQQKSSKYAVDSDDDDMLRHFTDRADRASEWTSASASWTMTSSADERRSVPSSGLRALYEV